jgi:FkbM family methyltransferase
MAVTRGNCIVYAFEPSYSTYYALNQNILLNKYQDKIYSFPILLSDETKLYRLEYSNVTPGAAMHNMSDTGRENESQFKTEFIQTIPGYRLDDFIKQFKLRTPNHIKLDVDGAEYRVLLGASETLAQSELRSVLVEVDEEKYSEREIQLLMERKGFFVHSRHLRPLSSSLANYIFERKE